MLIISFLSCKNDRKIKYAGFDDKVVGSETINLYDNGEFSIELGLGYQKGTYEVLSDTIFLNYLKETDFPKKFLLKENEIVSLDSKSKISIKRTDKNRVDQIINGIPQGNFKYEIYFSEFDGRMPNRTCNVEIKKNKIVVSQDETTNLTGGKIIFDGIILKHKSGKWILADKNEDINADEIGGCTDLPIIDFDKKLIEWC